MSAKRGLRIRGLRQRWLVNAVLPIVLVVIAIVTVYTLGVRRTYYSAMRSGLETRARVAADNFSSYGLKSYSEYFRYASITAETFEEKDRLELQFINVTGRVQVSSYGLTAGTPGAPETAGGRHRDRMGAVGISGVQGTIRPQKSIGHQRSKAIVLLHGGRWRVQIVV